tara:strand:- start:840 stop:1007 length:168 start_codon:yes stop_codon:yes gene_type:complete
MEAGDTIKATWTDGLVMEGTYLMHDKGYIILIDSNGEKIICNPSCVRFEVVNESR